MLLYLLTLLGMICATGQNPSAKEQLFLSEGGSAKASIDSISGGSIPGGSNFKFCPESSPDTDLFTVERIHWDPHPPTISRDQKLFVNGVFAVPIPQDTITTWDLHIPEWHHPYAPASNYSGNISFCESCNYIYQFDNERGLHKACDGADGGNHSPPDAGSAVLVHEDFLFWPIPDGEWYVKLDNLMPDQEDGAPGRRIFCVEGTEFLHY